MLIFESYPISALILLSALVTVILLGALISDIYTWYHLPRGPLPIPFIGNALQIPKDNPWIGRSPVLIISSGRVAHDLVEKKGALYGSRPRSIIFDELFNERSSIVALPYGPSWQIRRKLFHTPLKSSALADYLPRQEAEASKMALEILKDPAQWSSIIYRFNASIIFTVAYGRRIDGLDAKVVKKRLELTHFVAALIIPNPVRALFLPILIRLPLLLSPWVKNVVLKGNEEAQFNKMLVDQVKADLAETGGKGGGSITETVLSWKENNAKGMELLNGRALTAVPGTAFNAGVDTSASTMHTAILALLINPGVSLKAQNEIDEYLGTTRSPAFSDRQYLSYIEALIREALRVRPAVPLGIPHATLEKDTIGKWHIPAGTRVFVSAQAMNRDPTFFPSPEISAPERHLPSSDPRFDASLIGERFPNKYGSGAFGFGRRACVGADLAMNSMWTALAKLIWGFELVGVDGMEYEGVGYKGVAIQHAEKFECTFRVRSEVHKEVLEREMIDAGRVLDFFKPFE